MADQALALKSELLVLSPRMREALTSQLTFEDLMASMASQ